MEDTQLLEKLIAKLGAVAGQATYDKIISLNTKKEDLVKTLTK
jgi:hypothetical protein